MVAGPSAPDRESVLAWLEDWLETGPIPSEGLRRVLVVGEPAGAELLAAWLPAGQVVVRGEIPVGDQFDLVAVLDVTGTAAGAAEMSAAGAAVGLGGALLLLTPSDTYLAAVSPQGGRELGAGGLRLVAFDDLADGSAAAPGRRWLRLTYRRVTR